VRTSVHACTQESHWQPDVTSLEPICPLQQVPAAAQSTRHWSTMERGGAGNEGGSGEDGGGSGAGGGCAGGVGGGESPTPFSERICRPIASPVSMYESAWPYQWCRCVG